MTLVAQAQRSSLLSNFLGKQVCVDWSGQRRICSVLDLMCIYALSNNCDVFEEKSGVVKWGNKVSRPLWVEMYP